MGGAHGVCYGMNGNNLPSRGDVVQMYKSNNIQAMRIYGPDHAALDALRGSGIALTLDVGGVDDVRRLAGSASEAAAWVQAHVQPYFRDVVIRYVAVGNEVPAGDAAGILLPAMRNVRDALASAGIGVKVSTAVSFDVFTDTFPPSRGAFRNPSIMSPVAQFLASTNAPLLVNVYPYFAYRGDPGNINLNYATFRPGATPVRDSGNGLVYTNLFDAMVDAVVAALEKAGAGNVEVVVSESGWPSAGGFAASVDNARAYNQGVVDNVGNGTPKRSGKALETYVFAMFNENQKPGEEIERHFGLFNPDKSPVYQITFPS
ncbi:unnamed protein product [Urochloa decumbens]|uniref:Uncharacterized protein n=1 Tax=Urochloa decumbens TaxID=240449 RepID=A0ABC8YNT2_9POAL